MSVWTALAIRMVLVGDRLSVEVRILAVSDVVEAMGTHRPYRPARSKDEILQELKSGRGTKYDASVVDVLLEIIEGGESAFGYHGQNFIDAITTKFTVPSNGKSSVE